MLFWVWTYLVLFVHQLAILYVGSLLFHSSQSVAVLIHSLAFPVRLVHFLKLSRHCIDTQCPY